MKLQILNASLAACLSVCLTSCDRSPQGMTPSGGAAALVSSDPTTADLKLDGDQTPVQLPATNGRVVKIQPSMPEPLFIGSFFPPSSIPNFEKPGYPPVTSAYLPEGTKLLSAKARVTSSCPNPFTGSLQLVTDGEKDGLDGYFVELDPGKQWVQIDLGADKEVWGIWLWHFHKHAVVYKGVVVQVSNDPEFKTATTVYNNDYDDSVGFGIGTDACYVETNNGRFLNAKGAKGRYVRLWSNGRYIDEFNHYIEVEVYGK